MIALGIILVVVGAIFTFALSASVDGLNLVMIGYILMAAGTITFVVGLVRQFATKSHRMETTRQVSDDGRTVVEDKKVN